MMMKVTLATEISDHPLYKIFVGILALNHVRFRACQISGFHSRRDKRTYSISVPHLLKSFASIEKRSRTLPMV